MEDERVKMLVEKGQTPRVAPKCQAVEKAVALNEWVCIVMFAFVLMTTLFALLSGSLRSVERHQLLQEP